MAYLSPISYDINLDTIASGNITKRISYWTHPFFKTPPPILEFAKSTIAAFL
jgi:hypothetical protein